MNRHNLIKWLNVSLILIILISTHCKKEEESAGLNKEILNNIFKSFTPVYNYPDEETKLIAHVAMVNMNGLETWNDCRGSKDTLGEETVTMESMFRVGSVTKMFTAVVILQLWEAGIINLDAPFNDYLLLDEQTYPKINLFSSVTVRNLLSHRSGIPLISSTSFFNFHDYPDEITQLERMDFLFTECDPEFPPGTQYAYRNSNFNILGLIIEKVTGKEYYKVLEERIYSRININNTRLLNCDIQPDDNRIAHGYTLGFDGNDYHGSQAWAAGGLLSNVEDLSVFMRSLVDGKLFDNKSTFDLMITPSSGSSYGLGIFVWETPEGWTYGHGGGIFGYNTRLEYFPSVNTCVISTMSFKGYDFMVTNWYDDFCYPIIREVKRAKQN